MRGGRFAFALGLITLISTATIATADEIAKIAVTENGPSHEIPTNAPFYITGKAGDQASRVQILIVRTGNPYLWGGDPESCEVVDARVGAAQFAGGKKELRKLDAGDTTADRVWARAPRAWKVRASKAHVFTPGKAKTFELLFDKDPSFFAAGHAFCFFLYETSEEPMKDYALAAEVLSAVEAYNDCGYQGIDDVTSCSVDRTKIDTLVSAVVDDKEAAAKAMVDAGIPVAYQLLTGRRRANVILTRWIGDAVKRRATVATPLATNSDLRNAIAGVLWKANALPAANVASASIAIVYDGAGHPVSITADGAIVRTADLPIPGTRSTLRDVLELSHGRLPLDGDHVVGYEYARRLAPIFAADAVPLTEAEARRLDDAIASLETLDETLRKVHASRPTGAAAPALPTDGRTLWDLSGWLATDVEEPCQPGFKVAWKAPVTCGAGGGWASYSAGGMVARVAFYLDDFRTAQREWVKTRPAIEETIVTSNLLSRPFGARVEMTQSTWVFSYLSPVVGYAMTFPDRAGRNDVVSLRYYGLQLHVRPNPGNQPRLDAGVFAFELGMSPGVGSFGPDSRFRGFRGVAPLFAGLAIHPLPYTSFSVGWMLADKRSTTLAQESYSTYWGTYVGVTVDANVPELVRALFNKTSTTGAVPGKQQ